MDMTAEEIVRHYQQAKVKSKDIGVLAELNATDTASIRAILIDAGVMQPDKKSGKSQSPETRAALAAAIAEGLDNGQSPEEIARACDCTVQTVQNHIRRRTKAARKADAPAEPASAQVEAQVPSPDTHVYDKVETIIGALPADADEDTRICAFDLCMRLLRRELLLRLGVER